MRNSKGFTYIEAIVVIAILAVMAAGVVSGIGQVAGWRVTDCASDIDIAMKNTKVNAMSKSSAWLEISVDASGDYYLQEKGGAKEKIASGNISITYTNNRGRTVDIKDEIGRRLIISYNRSSGAFTPVIKEVEDDGSFTFMKYKNLDGSESNSFVYCSSITITNGTRTKTITLVKDTGKHTLE